jgi:DNA-binding response OmpR family regulator
MQNALKVLIVDDEPLFSEFLTKLLQIEVKNVSVKTSLDGFNAGKHLREFLPDIVLLDVMLPGFDGFRICKQIKNDPQYNHIRVIAMTGSKTDEIENRLVSAGAEICFEKPINMEKLLDHIKCKPAN